MKFLQCSHLHFVHKTKEKQNNSTRSSSKCFASIVNYHNYFLLTGHHDPPAGRKLCMQRLIHAQGLSTLADKLRMVFRTSKLKNCMVPVFVLKKCICMGNYLLLSGHYIWWDFVYGKNGFTTNDWQEKHILVYLVDFVQFLHRINFVQGTFEDFLSGTKFVKLRQTIQIC